MLMRTQRGQVTVEVAVLFGFVVAALVAMAMYLQRGVQGGVKSNADSLGSQFSANIGWKTMTNSTTNETKTAINSTQGTSYNQTL